MSPTSGVDGVWRPNANVITSVCPRWPRWRRLRSAMVRRETKAMDSIAERTRSLRSTNPASSRTEPVASESRRRPVSTSMPGSAVEVRGIRLDDLAHEPMANDVDVREIVERDPLDPGENALDLDEPRFLAGRQVDLRFVAGDDRARIHAESRQEHLHLGARCVLCLVENHEGIAQRATAHVGQRCDLDDPCLEGFLHSLGG